MEQFSDSLLAAVNRVGSPVCIGLDPVLEALPEELRARHHDPLGAVSEFCRGVLEAVAGLVPAIKFQSACFERYGSRGVAVLEECTDQAARAGFIVVLDAKRGDISTSASHYAAAAKRLGAHCITVNGYLGASGVQPFLEAGLGVFVLVRTSNPDSDAVQGQMLADGRTVAELLADQVAGMGEAHLGRSGLSSVGAVVGATKSAEGAALRRRMPDQVFLIPGYGAQGGKAENIRAMVRTGAQSPGHAGVLVTASRSVIYAKGAVWTEAVREAARQFAVEVAGVIT